MDQLMTAAPIKSALFVDFDNIYIGLSKTDPAAAERFASDPARWLAWLEKGLPARGGTGLDGEKASPVRARSILIRRCYPNPDAGFRRFRSFFTSSAFSVIDCPSLTRTGKNSSDIYMVMDILDTLSHKTHFDEFIIFSGDSDFMPVLLRLRAHDRRTTTLAIDFMPPAYKASCDLVISEEEFIEEALGISSEGNCGAASAGRMRVPMPLLKEMAARVYDAACEGGEVAGADLPDILKDFREFRDSTNWLGFGTSQRLAEALSCAEPRLQVVRLNPMMYKLEVQSQPPAFEPVERPAIPLAPTMTLAERPVERPAQHLVERGGINGERGGPHAATQGVARGAEKPGKTELARLRGQIIAAVKELVGTSRTAILLARASQHVVNKLGPQVLETQWAGMGSFKRLLQNAGDLGLEITTQPEPGYIYDPQRHSPPGQREQPTVAAPAMADAGQEPTEAAEHSEREAYLEEAYDEEDEAEDFEESLPSMEEFARRVSQVTGAPDLAPSQYALIFRGIVQELQEIASGQKIYNTYQSSKAISDWCAENGVSIARNDVVLVLKGIIFQDGVRFSKRPGSYTALELATVVRNNIRALCRRSRLELSEYESHLLDEWILGDLQVENSTYPLGSDGGNGRAEENAGYDGAQPAGDAQGDA